MNRTTLAIAALAAIGIALPGAVVAQTINSQLTRQQVIDACTGTTGDSVNASVSLADGSTVSGTVDCNPMNLVSGGSSNDDDGAMESHDDSHEDDSGGASLSSGGDDSHSDDGHDGSHGGSGGSSGDSEDD